MGTPNMDDFLFRSSQKFEHLQFRAELATAKSKDVFVLYIQQGKVLLLRFWNNPLAVQIRNHLKEDVSKVVRTAENLKVYIINYSDPTRLYYGLMNLLSKRWTKRDVIFGCSGLFVGVIIGIALGLSMRKKEPEVRYMQAIQCNNYSGIESVTVVEDALAPYECGDHDVLVSVKAASVQIIDTFICRGYGRTYRRILRRMREPSSSDLPVTLGRDCTGIVTDIGNQVKRLEVGDKILVLGGCTPVGCVLLQLLKFWQASVTTTCYKRAVPVVKALKATEIIVIEFPTLNDHFQEDEAAMMKNVLLKELEIRSSTYDVIINTNVDDGCLDDFSKFLNSDGCMLSTLPPKLSSDSCGTLSRFLLYCYTLLKHKVQTVLGLPGDNFEETHLCHVTLDALTELVEEGNLQTVVDKVYQPHDIEIALHHIQSSQSIGSSVITFR